MLFGSRDKGRIKNRGGENEEKGKKPCGARMISFILYLVKKKMVHEERKYQKERYIYIHSMTE